LKVGDYLLAGKHSGKVKAMFDERGKTIELAPPSTPVSILGLDGAPQAGDNFNVLEDEREAKQIAAKRTQLLREQNVRTQRHITLDEIGRRIALGDFKELNMILKGDVDGSVEALTDSLQKLSTEEIQVNIIHKGVGAITESDVLLASASDAIVIGFNVRPMGNARMLAEKEEIDIRSYSIIYDAINDVKDAMEGLLSPEMKEEVTGNAEIRETFKISKVGTIAGCMVTTGKIYRNSNIRVIREGVVQYSGVLSSLKRFKDDVKEVAKGYDCGLQIKNYNDIQVEDMIEFYQEVAVKKTL
jgi:translation initiation factor IF-2